MIGTILKAIGNFIVKNLSSILVIITIGVVITLFFSSSVSCCGYKSHRFDGIPEECNIMYNTFDVYSKSDDKSATDDPSEWCKDIVAALREEIKNECKQIIYGTNRITFDKTETKKLRVEKYYQYKKCVSGDLEYLRNAN